MKLIDGDNLLEEAAREKLDTREAILNMITRQPEVIPCIHSSIFSKSEASAVAQHIDSTIFDYIRNDTDVDSLNWLINIIEAYKKLCIISGYVGMSENGKEEWRREE